MLVMHLMNVMVNVTLNLQYLSVGYFWSPTNDKLTKPYNEHLGQIIAVVEYDVLQ